MDVHQAPALLLSLLVGSLVLVALLGLLPVGPARAGCLAGEDPDDDPRRRARHDPDAHDVRGLRHDLDGLALYDPPRALLRGEDRHDPHEHRHGPDDPRQDHDEPRRVRHDPDARAHDPHDEPHAVPVRIEPDPVRKYDPTPAGSHFAASESSSIPSGSAIPDRTFGSDSTHPKPSPRRAARLWAWLASRSAHPLRRFKMPHANKDGGARRLRRGEDNHAPPAMPGARGHTAREHSGRGMGAGTVLPPASPTRKGGSNFLALVSSAAIHAKDRDQSLPTLRPSPSSPHVSPSTVAPATRACEPSRKPRTRAWLVFLTPTRVHSHGNSRRGPLPNSRTLVLLFGLGHGRSDNPTGNRSPKPTHDPRPGPDLGRAEPRCTTSQRTDRRMVLRRAPGFLLTICTAIRRTRAACSRSPRPTLGRYPDSPKLANPKKGTRRPTSSILPIEDSSRILVTWSAGWNASSGSTPHPTPPPTFGPVRKPEVVPERDPAPVSFALLVATIPAAPSPAILAKLAALLGLALVALVLLPPRRERDRAPPHQGDDAHDDGGAEAARVLHEDHGAHVGATIYATTQPALCSTPPTPRRGRRQDPGQENLSLRALLPFLDSMGSAHDDASSGAVTVTESPRSRPKLGRALSWTEERVEIQQKKKNRAASARAQVPAPGTGSRLVLGLQKMCERCGTLLFLHSMRRASHHASAGSPRRLSWSQDKGRAPPTHKHATSSRRCALATSCQAERPRNSTRLILPDQPGKDETPRLRAPRARGDPRAHPEGGRRHAGA